MVVEMNNMQKNLQEKNADMIPSHSLISKHIGGRSRKLERLLDDPMIWQFRFAPSGFYDDDYAYESGRAMTEGDVFS
jgi:hypothetical protein